VPSDDSHYTKLRNSTGIQTEAALNELLSQTTIKKACCMGKQDITGKYFKTTVKIPVPKDYVPKPGEDTQFINKFGYVSKEVLVPIEMCPNNFKPPTGTNTQEVNNYEGYCDRFMYAYCENEKYLYNKEADQPTNDEFSYYAPTCPCFIDPPEQFKLVPGVQPGCYAPGCTLANQSAYIDKGTRVRGGCDASFCISVQNIGGITATEKSQAKLDNKVVQNCDSTRTTIAKNVTDTGGGSSSSSTGGSSSGASGGSSGSSWNNDGTARSNNQNNSSGGTSGTSGSSSGTSGSSSGTSGSSSGTSGSSGGADSNQTTQEETKKETKTEEEEQTNQEETTTQKAPQPKNMFDISSYLQGNNMMSVAGSVLICCCVVLIIVVMLVVMMNKGKGR